MIKYHDVIRKLTSKVENDSESQKQLPVGVDILLDRIKEKGFVVHVQRLEFNNIDIQLMNQEDCQRQGLTFEHFAD